MSKQTELAQLGDTVTVSSDNVGIGIISPSKKLDVDTTMRVTNAAGSSAAELDVASGSTWRLRSNPTSGTNSYGLDFIKGSAGTDVKMSINSSGNVGIGTSSPAYTIDAASSGNTQIHLKASGQADGLEVGQLSADGGSAITATNNNYLKFGTNNTERMRIDSSGNVGIGETNPSANLHVNKGTNPASAFPSGNWAAKIFNQTDASTEHGLVVANRWAASASTAFEVGGLYDAGNGFDTFFKVDGVGYVGIGTSSPSNVLHVKGENQLTLEDTSSGNIGQVYAANTATVISSDPSNSIASSNIIMQVDGSERMRIDNIGRLLVGKTAQGLSTAGFEVEQSGQTSVTQSGASCIRLNRLSSDGDIIQLRKDTSQIGSIGSKGGSTYVSGSTNGIRFLGARVQPCNTSGSLVDNQMDLGYTTSRFDDIYATNGTIQTSDRNEKQDIAELTEAEQRVAVAAKGLLRKFRWKSAVEEKGEAARTHFGIIAQDLQAAFEAEGLDAGDYAMFISSTWTDEETGEERTRLGVRYSELLAFIIGAE